MVSSTASAAPPSLSPPFFPPFFFFANAMCRPEDRRTGEGALSTWVPAWGIAGLYRPAFGAIRITDTLMTRPDIGSVDMTMARETEEGCEIKIGQLVRRQSVRLVGWLSGSGSASSGKQQQT